MVRKVTAILIFFTLAGPVKSWGDSLWGTLTWDQDNWYTIGDLNNDQLVNLTDAILALKINTNNTIGQQIFKEADINGDGSLGHEEAIYAFQIEAGLKTMLDKDGDSFSVYQGDCDDTNNMINPNALDFCGDGIDQDCNGTDLVCLPAEFHGGWQRADNSAEEFLFLTIFNDGVYMLGQNTGMEFGTFSLDTETNIVSVHTVYDQNGDNGASDLPPDTTMTVSGDTLTFMIPGEGAAEFARVVDTPSSLVGAWHFGTDEHKIGFITSLTIYDNSTYIYCNYESANPEETELEFGTYTYENDKITLTVVVDQNGDSGTSSIDGVPLPVVINGDEMTVTIPDGGDEVFYRVN